MPARKMVKLRVEETSGVDHPAHMEEGWIVMKAAKEAPMANGKKKFPMDKEMMDSEDETMASGTEGEDMEEEDDVEIEITKMRDERDAYKSKYEDMVKRFGAPEDDEDTMEKAAPAPVRDALRKAREEAQAAREELRKEIEGRRNREFVNKAAEWTALSLDAEAFGPELRRLADFDADLADTVAKALSSANAQADAANIFAELGTQTRPDSGDAYGRMTRMAKAAVDSGEHKTVEQAMSALVLTHPELYEAYRAEQGR